ncbi:DUF7405 family protein [Natrialbaceae archaeon A-gly3]
MTRSRGISRRSFVRSAVAIGGASALAACMGPEAGEEIPQATLEADELPTRQHAWNEFVPSDDHGNSRVPEHHVLLTLEYVGDGPDEEREQLEDAFRTLERAFERGSDGLAFTVGYSPSYFDRFEADLPDSVDLPHPEALADIENPELDTYDALIHLSSDYGSAVLWAEEALKGEKETVNGVEVEGDLEGVFEIAERRTGFVGDGLPAENQDVSGVPDSEPVPEESPLFMGFKSGFKHNQATEDRVTIQDGPFAGGTTTHLSKLHIDLHQWYEQDSREQRVQKMFCPAHNEEDRVEGAGHNLGDSSGVEGCAHRAKEDARSGVVGHGQKAARAREDGQPIILRRDFNSTDDDEPGLHFLSHQREIADFLEVREKMTGADLAESGAIGSRTNNGILQYLHIRRRANYLVPPREHRALPRPNPDA